MSYWATALVVLLVVTGLPRTSVAQARVGQATGQRTSTTGQAQQRSAVPSNADRAADRSPSPGGRFTSRLMFVPPSSDAQQMRSSTYPAFAWGLFGFDVFWPRYTVSPEVIYQLPLPPREGAPLGGLQLDVEPRRAQVYVDGSYAGLVDAFSGYYHHLDLPAGPHLIEIFEPGYQPLILEIVVSPGRTTTYRGALTRSPGD